MSNKRYHRTRDEIRADIKRLNSPLADPLRPGCFVPRDQELKAILLKRLNLELLTTRQPRPEGASTK